MAPPGAPRRGRQGPARPPRPERRSAGRPPPPRMRPGPSAPTRSGSPGPGAHGGGSPGRWAGPDAPGGPARAGIRWRRACSRAVATRARSADGAHPAHGPFRSGGDAPRCGAGTAGRTADPLAVPAGRPFVHGGAGRPGRAAPGGPAVIRRTGGGPPDVRAGVAAGDRGPRMVCSSTVHPRRRPSPPVRPAAGDGRDRYGWTVATAASKNRATVSAPGSTTPRACSPT